MIVRHPDSRACGAPCIRAAALLLAAAGGLVAGCGGDPSPPDPGLPLLPRPPVVPVDGPAWSGFGGNAQHSALGQIATQQLRGFYWYTPVDLAPQYAAARCSRTTARR